MSGSKTIQKKPLLETRSRSCLHQNTPSIFAKDTGSRKTPLRATHDHEAAKYVDEPVKFYHKFDPNFEFSNFFPCEVTIFGKDWPTTEHFFQAQKFVGTPIEEKIRTCKTAMEALETARRPAYSSWIRSDWHSGVKDRVMLLAVHSKFSQHKSLQEKLFQTGSREIIEHTSNDSYWGDGGGGRHAGKNKLGKFLEEVREILDPGRMKRDQLKRAQRKRSSSVDHVSRHKDCTSYCHLGNAASRVSPAPSSEYFSSIGKSKSTRRSHSSERCHLPREGGSDSNKISRRTYSDVMSNSLQNPLSRSNTPHKNDSTQVKDILYH